MISADKACKVPVRAGMGLRVEHLHEECLRTGAYDIAWLEIHAETFLVAGGQRLEYLRDIAQHYPLSVHCVGMSLGSAGGLDAGHLGNIRALIDELNPALVSDHLAWSVEGGAYLNDLLPVPLNDESLQVMIKNIGVAQDRLGRQILIENPSLYLVLDEAYSQGEFLQGLVDQTGCGLLLDVNNVYICAQNMKFCAYEYLDNYPMHAVQEIHVAGHLQETINDGQDVILIDSHGECVAKPVWDLLEYALARTGPKPVLMEWDSDVPSIDILHGQAKIADQYILSAVKSHATG